MSKEIQNEPQIIKAETFLYIKKKTKKKMF